ncbi:S8 family serine peptidase [Microbacterium paludicola]|uniref:S8 family serine peptidase n=1 Tax=Microbacterium paludicola TaxID=300019 RepID=UPI0012F4A5FF|nr:S8 family serine peptidase [Microbacterium paludicola]
MIDTGVSADLDVFSRYVIDTVGPESVSDAHGTMMMSVILGVTDEAIALPSEGLEVLSINVGTSPPAASIADAIDGAVDAGAELISISMGVRRGSVALETAVQQMSESLILPALPQPTAGP